MALAHFQETIGRVLADGDVFIGSGASVEVRDETNGALAAIFVDRDGVTPKSNPFNADSQGFADFYVASGRYRVKVSINGDVTLDLRDLEMVGPLESLPITTSTGTQTLVEALDDRELWAADLAGLKSLLPADLTANQAARITTTVRSGSFTWVAGDQSANVTADPQEGVWVAPDEDATGASGAWRREVSHFVTPKMFGAIGDGSDATIAFQGALDSGYKVIVPPGDYEISAQIELAYPFDIEFLEGSTIINALVSPDPVETAIFHADGEMSSVTTVTGEFNREETDSIDVVDASGISVDDFVVFEEREEAGAQFCARVLSISSNTLTLDRTPSCDILDGGNVYVVTQESKGRFVGAHFDGNGTPGSPRYGFGFRARMANGVYVANITGEKIGSRLVEITRGMDNRVENVTGKNFTDVSPGRGYVCRVATGNDNEVYGVKGLGSRHVVDLTAASRNNISDCTGINNPAVDFLTHSNGCVANVFRGCNSYNNSTAAYSISPNSGDRENNVFGGIVKDSVLIRNEPPVLTTDQKRNKLYGVQLISTKPPGRLVRYSCELHDCILESFAGSIFSDPDVAMSVRMFGGVIRQYGLDQRPIAEMADAASAIRLYNTIVFIESAWRAFTSSSKTLFSFFGCNLLVVNPDTGNNAVIAYGSFDLRFQNCHSSASIDNLAFSDSTGNDVFLRNSAFPEVGQVSNSSAGSEINLNTDRQSLWSIQAIGPTATQTIIEPYNTA